MQILPTELSSSSFFLKENVNELIVKSINSLENYAIFLTDAFGHVQTWNDGARLIKGWLDTEILGKHFSLFYLEEDIAAHLPQRALRIAGEKGKFEEQGWRLRKNGETYWANIVVTSVKTDEIVVAYSVVIQDLTANRLNEDVISELQDSLKLRDEFISVASHELRTPVTRILLNLQLIKRMGLSVSEKMIKSVEVCEASTKDLIALIDNLVDVNQLRLGKLTVKRTKTNITAILLEVLAKFSDEIRLSGNKVSLDHDGDIIGYCDQTRLEQLFSSFLSNSLKYAQGKDIRMELRNSSDYVFFFIEDDGPGIPLHMRTRIFERFERASDHRKVSGLGLGLYVSRRIVEAHQGEIKLHQERGKGARFIVRFPLKKSKNIFD